MGHTALRGATKDKAPPCAVRALGLRAWDRPEGAGGWALCSEETGLTVEGVRACTPCPSWGMSGQCSQERAWHVPSCQAGGSLVSQVLRLLGWALTHFDGTVGREGTARGATECQVSPPQTPTPVLQEQTTQVGDETAVTGECGWAQPRIGPAHGRAGWTGRRGMKQRPRPSVAMWSLLFSYFNFNGQGGPKGQASPSARIRECLLTGRTARPVLRCRQPLAWWEVLVWAQGCG